MGDWLLDAFRVGTALMHVHHCSTSFSRIADAFDPVSLNAARCPLTNTLLQPTPVATAERPAPGAHPADEPDALLHHSDPTMHTTHAHDSTEEPTSPLEDIAGLDMHGDWAATGFQHAAHSTLRQRRPPRVDPASGVMRIAPRGGMASEEEVPEQAAPSDEGAAGVEGGFEENLQAWVDDDADSLQRVLAGGSV